MTKALRELCFGSAAHSEVLDDVCKLFPKHRSPIKIYWPEFEERPISIFKTPFRNLFEELISPMLIYVYKEEECL